jgi:hypothetical protein
MDGNNPQLSYIDESRRNILRVSATVLGSYGLTATVEAQSGSNTVQGTVLEQDGDPIEGSTVRVPLSEGDIETTTDSAGTFTIDWSCCKAV